ncbi:MAG: hypothetical protein ACM3U1_03670 [Chloroflexota bacterium]
MKLVLWALVSFFVLFSAGKAQDEDPFAEKTPERLKFYKEKYDTVYAKPFEIVWKGVLKSLEDENCQTIKKSYKQTDDGVYKGSIHSDYCLLTQNKDSAKTVLDKFSYAMPIIRGGTWTTARFQYKFIVAEQKDGTVSLEIRGEISGREDYVTTQVHFWKSNGILETEMMKKVSANIDALSRTE